jgi:hypothetical protein
VRAAEKAAQQQQVAALAGVALTAQSTVDDGLQCWKIHSVHGELQCAVTCLGSTQAPPVDVKQIHYLVYGSFAATEDGIGKDELRLVTFKELLMNCSDEDVRKLSTYEKDPIQPHRVRDARKRLFGGRGGRRERSRLKILHIRPGGSHF